MRRFGFTTIELLVTVSVFLVLTVIPVLALWTDRTLGFWVSYAKGTTVDTPYWIALLASIPVPFTFMCNVATEIIRLFM